MSKCNQIKNFKVLLLFDIFFPTKHDSTVFEKDAKSKAEEKLIQCHVQPSKSIVLKKM